jgi:two-component system OmpR family response regulator
MSKILVVDDDTSLLEVMKYNLAHEGHAVVTAGDGIRALELAREEKPDLIVLDLMLPGLNGLEVCRILRKETAVPVLMLTARAGESDKVVGLESGADDYMTKPFSVRELLARIRAMLRRAQMKEAQGPTAPPDHEFMPRVLKIQDFEIDLRGHRVFHAGMEIRLSPKEFELLSFLAHHQGQVFNRERLVENVWGYDYGGTARTVDVHIRSLRRKIEATPEQPEHLLTIHGVGYKFEG